VSTFFAAALALWLALHAAIGVRYRRDLRRLWREPVLRHPVLVLESDDWGAGPPPQADALRRIAGVLQRFRDRRGAAPSLNIALVLAVPDGPAIAMHGAYRRVELDAPVFGPILDALRAGSDAGVFALQLHGLEHYWPPALMASADTRVQAWLRGPVPATTEALPSALQSRWVNAASLPSTPHDPAAVDAAVRDEVAVYARLFGQAPVVVVPPTFVWTTAVESAWARAGLQCVVTPGWRYVRRDADGLPGGDEGPLATGDRAGPLVYVARADYFEPARGRGAEHALRALRDCVAQGRACVLENHRDNFIGDAATCDASLAQLERLLAEALRACPSLRFLSTAELARAVRDRDPAFVHTRWRDRAPCLMQRLRRSGRPWTLMRLSGLGALLAAAAAV
jgi:hypothetical protein